MAYYDFSCKHHIMLENKDGSLLPMDEPYFEAKEIREDTWSIFSAGDYSYLLKGEGMAMLFDSGYGAGNIREFCEELCKISVPWIANTHEHFDHTANNGYFDLAYMSEIAYPNATIPYASFEGIEFFRDYPVQFVKHGDIIPLKGREIMVFRIADHTPGGLAYLDKKGRCLITGDEIWPEKMLNVSVAEYGGYLETINEYRSCFDLLLAGERVFPAEIFDKQLINCRKVLSGEKGEPIKMKKRSPRPEREDGLIVYDRQFPHPGDKAKDLWGKGEPDRSRFYAISTDDVTLNYLPED